MENVSEGNRYPGSTELTDEILKVDGSKLQDFNMWAYQNGLGRICLIYGRKNKLQCENFRGILLLETSYRRDSSKESVKREVGKFRDGFRPFERGPAKLIYATIFFYTEE